MSKVYPLYVADDAVCNNLDKEANKSSLVTNLLKEHYKSIQVKKELSLEEVKAMQEDADRQINDLIAGKQILVEKEKAILTKEEQENLKSEQESLEQEKMKIKRENIEKKVITTLKSVFKEIAGVEPSDNEIIEYRALFKIKESGINNIKDYLEFKKIKVN